MMIYQFSKRVKLVFGKILARDKIMSSTLKSLRALSDPTRLRIVALLERDELSVNELQEITRLGQSRISTHLGLLRTARWCNRGATASGRFTS